MASEARLLMVWSGWKEGDAGLGGDLGMKMKMICWDVACFWVAVAGGKAAENGRAERWYCSRR